MNKYHKIAILLMAIYLLVIGFNTIDQMIIRYKYYDYWRSVEHWEMCYWWSPHWWDVYIISILFLILGGVLLGILILSLFK